MVSTILKGNRPHFAPLGHSGEYGKAAKLVEKMSKSVMQLISIHFEIGFSF